MQSRCTGDAVELLEQLEVRHRLEAANVHLVRVLARAQGGHVAQEPLERVEGRRQRPLGVLKLEDEPGKVREGQRRKGKAGGRGEIAP